MEDVEVFNPRIRFSRATRQGPTWVTESLFPNYLFARFDLKTSLSKVNYAPGVSGVVHFGSKWPKVPDAAIEEIRATLGKDDVHLISNDLAPGDPVQIAGGMFHGLKAIITQVMPGKQRVVVLMEFLGRQTAVDLGINSVIRESSRR
jgi:transcriptional antiterminator RfaH